MAKVIALFAFACSLFFIQRASANTHFDSMTISITARVEKFAEWADTGPVIVQSDWPAIDKVNQSRIVSKPLTLYSNTDAIITAQAGENNGILTQGSQTLTTAYKLTGKLANPDSAFKPAGQNSGEFFHAGNTYNVVHEPGVGAYPMTLNVQVTSPPDAATDPGLYTCTIILTVGW